ncbi:haloacid dehalogenase type II [Kibdelosporangium aridum]|uniref:2-haloacid dehalogenase n=1 Tax=Kibdelosporangium aridum TaxID=2030 RepID=A0A1W2FWR4_KIBAR|nr:haloacid dehalogenase type II [Kibdelosporangium aridum]SMD26407.1 2-haloacid dehalogenase [Kibdelosporangium aridum]
MAPLLPVTPRLITFDTYGTLIDWDSALRSYIGRLFAAKGVQRDVRRFHENWYYRHALPAVAGPFQPYRPLLEKTMALALSEVGVAADPKELSALGDVMADAAPFADAVSVLSVLKQHVPLATISNSQQDIIEISARKLGDPFTFIFTGEIVEAYKPHPALFELVLDRAGVQPHEVVHVAQSQYVDLPRSVSMGIPTVWINRQQQQLDPHTPVPTAELPDLHGLPSLLNYPHGNGSQL